MSAVSASREALIQLLLEHGADVHATNSSGQTSLHYAVRPGHLPPALGLCPICPQAQECTPATSSRGEVESKPLRLFWTRLVHHLVVGTTMQASKARTDGICRLLLAKGASATAKDSTGSAPVHRYRQSPAEHSCNLPSARNSRAQCCFTEAAKNTPNSVISP